MKKVFSFFVYCCLVACFLSGSANADWKDIKFITQKAKVITVEDGDTFILEFLNGSGRFLANLIAVDACGWTEFDGCFAEEAKEFLRNHIERKIVTVKWDSRDKVTETGHRLLVYIEIDGKDINKKVIANGYGWVPCGFSADRKGEYIKVEKEAKDNNRGLWWSCPELKEHLINRYYRRIY